VVSQGPEPRGLRPGAGSIPLVPRVVLLQFFPRPGPNFQYRISPGNEHNEKQISFILGHAKPPEENGEEDRNEAVISRTNLTGYARAPGPGLDPGTMVAHTRSMTGCAIPLP
jgi:hypothetical protein